MNRTSVALSLVLATTLAGASPVILEADFNSDSFSAGDLNNQNGWTVLQGTATVQSTVVNEGDQAVNLADNTIIDRAITAPGQTVVWTESHFRGAGTTAPPNYPTDTPASAIVHFSANAGEGIQLGDGDGAGNVTFVASGVTSIDPNHWYRITIRQDYSAKTWDCWIDGNLVGQDLGFRDNSVGQLNGFRQYAGVESYLDTFSVRRRSNGDLDLDGDTDAADVVLNVNAKNNPPTDPIAFDDADFDGNGTITSEDITSTVNLILGI